MPPSGCRISDDDKGHRSGRREVWPISTTVFREVHVRPCAKAVEELACLNVFLRHCVTPAVQHRKELTVKVADDHKAGAEEVPLGQLGPHRQGDFGRLVNQEDALLG